MKNEVNLYFCLLLIAHRALDPRATLDENEEALCDLEKLKKLAVGPLMTAEMFEIQRRAAWRDAFIQLVSTF